LIVKTIFLSMLNYKTVHTSSSPIHTWSCWRIG
jgi:hypothetical protein